MPAVWYTQRWQHSYTSSTEKEQEPANEQNIVELLYLTTIAFEIEHFI